VSCGHYLCSGDPASRDVACLLVEMHWAGCSLVSTAPHKVDRAVLGCVSMQARLVWWLSEGLAAFVFESIEYYQYSAVMGSRSCRMSSPCYAMWPAHDLSRRLHHQCRCNGVGQ
jgi:hypothetical protein